MPVFSQFNSKQKRRVSDLKVWELVVILVVIAFCTQVLYGAVTSASSDTASSTLRHKDPSKDPYYQGNLPMSEYNSQGPCDGYNSSSNPADDLFNEAFECWTSDQRVAKVTAEMDALNSELSSKGLYADTDATPNDTRLSALVRDTCDTSDSVTLSAIASLYKSTWTNGVTMSPWPMRWEDAVEQTCGYRPVSRGMTYIVLDLTDPSSSPYVRGGAGMDTYHQPTAPDPYN